MADTPHQDVPEELQQKQKTKEMEAQKAQDKIDAEVKRGEAFLVSIGYISFLCILPLVLLPENKFAQFHGKQALVLAIFIYFFDFVQIFPPLIASIYTILKTLVMVYAIVMSFKGKYFKIPFIYSLSERFNINVKPKHSAS